MIESHSEELLDKYPAFYYASTYGKSPETSDFKAPETSTGWYMPSAGNLWDIVRNLGEETRLDEFQNSNSIYLSLGRSTSAILNNINQRMAQIPRSQKFSYGAICTSSECNETNILTINLLGNLAKNLEIDKTSKMDSYSVRCVLAF